MAEHLITDPHKIAGLSNVVKEIAQDGYKIAIFVGQCCNVDGGNFGGKILEPLTAPFRVAAGADHENAGFVKPYLDPVAFPKAEEMTLDPPSAAPPELADIIADTTGIVGDVNDSIKNVTRMAGNEINILETILSPITANWNELRRIGESYKVAGNAMETSGKNLDNAVGRIGPTWDGKAAIAFEDWARRQSSAMKWEGPVGRVVSDVCNEVADKIRDGVRTACQKLQEFIKSFIEFRGAKDIFKLVVKKIPFVGTAIEVLDAARKIWNVVDLVKTIIQEIETVRNSLRTFLEFISSPADKGKQWVEQKLEPITSKVDNAAEKAALVNDIVEAAARAVFLAAADLETASRRVEHTDVEQLWNTPHTGHRRTTRRIGRHAQRLTRTEGLRRTGTERRMPVGAHRIARAAHAARGRRAEELTLVPLGMEPATGTATHTGTGPPTATEGR